MMNGHWKSTSSVSRMSSVVRLAVGVVPTRVGQLRQPDREIDVGARVIDAPVAAVAAEVAVNATRQNWNVPSKSSGLATRTPNPRWKPPPPRRRNCASTTTDAASSARSANIRMADRRRVNKPRTARV